ncbi:MAG: hypothetical protein ABIQ09_04180 [Jatrophihabitantaceae bacterium]
MLPFIRRIACLLGLLLTAALITPATAEASANLYHCSPLGNGYTYACTTITNAPSTGVRVWDRTTGTVVTWYNGTSVALYGWATDTGSSCGVNGDHYVWGVQWYASGFIHFGVLGDWWVATGAVSDWNGYTDSWGTLGNSAHNNGSGSGTCNTFFPTPGNWATP